MTQSTIAVVAPGDMGSAIGRRLVKGGWRVITDLTDRSPRSRELAAGAGITAVDGLAALAGEAEIVLSVMPPAAALDFAERFAAAAGAGRPLFVDLNAIAPATAAAIAAALRARGIDMIDGGIIGGPPRGDDAGPRIYVAGDNLARLDGLRDGGLDIRRMEGEVGAASGLKMCYASLTKGITALQIEALVAARALGCAADLHAELSFSQNALVARADAWLPQSCPKAYRWVGEMEEIADTFAAVGLTPDIFRGVADIYRFVEATPLGRETPENRSLANNAGDVSSILAAALPAAAKD